MKNKEKVLYAESLNPDIRDVKMTNLITGNRQEKNEKNIQIQNTKSKDK